MVSYYDAAKIRINMNSTKYLRSFLLLYARGTQRKYWSAESFDLHHLCKGVAQSVQTHCTSCAEPLHKVCMTVAKIVRGYR